MKLRKSPITEKSVFTRMCISEAILRLMKRTSFDRLKISAIVKTAGVSRMTFYKYYTTPYEALTDYLKILIDVYIKEDTQQQQEPSYYHYEHVLFSLKFFDRYADYFLTLSHHHLDSILISGISEFMSERIDSPDPLSLYKLSAYGGGLLNVFLYWETEGKKECAESVAAAICELYHLDTGK